MMKPRGPGRPLFRLFVFLAAMSLVVTACTSDDDGDAATTTQATQPAGQTGVSQSEFDRVSGELSAAQSQISTLQDQLASASVRTVAVAGEYRAAPNPVDLPNDGWANEESVRGGLWLVFEGDSPDEGPDAWDIAAYPKVYFTSESYATINPAITDDTANWIGYHVIDAYTHEIVYSYAMGRDDGIGLMGGPITRGPHGVGVSPDGKYIYVGWSETPGDDRISYVGIWNVRTGKINKILKQESYFEGGMRSQALHHIQCWNDWEGNHKCILQWGFGANGGPHHILDPNDNNRVWKSITYDDVKPMGHPFTTPSPNGQYVYISMGANWIRGNHSPAAAVAKLDLATGEPTVIEGVGWHPIGITHTADGKYTYLIDGHSSHVYKIDNESNEVVDETSAGIAGPYGICLNWNEQEIWIVGKGEGTHNRGNSLAMVDAVGRFRASRAFNQPLHLGSSASSVDHCALHPDPDVNEIWVSNMAGWETIVVDLDTYTVTDHIPTPNGGDTHGMAFVWYDGGWDNGVLHADMGGPKSEAMWQIVRDRVAADATE